jgi:hypothetical protein
MKVAVINGFHFHYEMIGHVLDYCKNKLIEVDCYTNMQSDMGWFSLYNEYYNISQWFSLSNFIPSKYEYTFILTDDDGFYNKSWNTQTKIIVIEHCSTRQLKLPAYKTLQIRQFNHRIPQSDPNAWVVPIWDFRPSDKYTDLTVTCIGGCSPRNKTDLTSIFSNFIKIQFNIINRYNVFDTSLPNVKIYNSIDTNEMLTIAAKSHYILLLPNYNSSHKDISMSASIPIAYSVGTPILMSQSFAIAYGYKGIVVLSESLMNLTYPTEEQMNHYREGKNDLRKQRDDVFNSILI